MIKLPRKWAPPGELHLTSSDSFRQLLSPWGCLLSLPSLTTLPPVQIPLPAPLASPPSLSLAALSWVWYSGPSLSPSRPPSFPPVALAARCGGWRAHSQSRQASRRKKTRRGMLCVSGKNINLSASLCLACPWSAYSSPWSSAQRVRSMLLTEVERSCSLRGSEGRR